MASNQSESPAPLSLPHLHMRRPHLDGLPPLQVPESYVFRTYRPGDEAAWAAIMNTGIGSGWTADRCREKLTGKPWFSPDGLFFAVPVDAGPNGTPVGSTCGWLDRFGESEVGFLHMVCVLPEHRGHRLGYWLSLAVLRYFAERGFREVRLTTDDFRLAGIKSYLGLGFQPEHLHPADGERWLRVRATLRESNHGLP
ncbi:MAG TPA: GNAT family N-acetyltransferase [Chloroflexota bacterium]|nr:GNAT family N-acetyltransferase [Chloroflexota bacterium]